jgi:hypothetical protein
MKRKGQVALILCMIVCVLLLLAAPVFAQPSDIQGHWANQQISNWVDSGYISGYPDGTFKPDNSITRAEFMVLVNKSFKFTVEAGINYNDVSPSDWFYGDLARARAAGYITGFPDGTMRPDSPISREQAATIVMYINKLKANAGAANGFTDAAAMIWSKGTIGAVAEADIMNGYPDQTFQPFGLLTRAEAVVTLERALAAGVTIEQTPENYTISADVSANIGGETETGTTTGGGGGGGGGATALKVTAATITVNNIDYDAVITSGKNGTVSFAALAPSAVLSEGRINVSKDSTLVLTVPANEFTDRSLSMSQALDAGWNTLDVIDYLGALYPDGGFTLAKMREVFGGGSVVTFDGTLTAGSEVVDISLVVTLP